MRAVKLRIGAYSPGLGSKLADRLGTGSVIVAGTLALAGTAVLKTYDSPCEQKLRGDASRQPPLSRCHPEHFLQHRLLTGPRQGAARQRASAGGALGRVGIRPALERHHDGRDVRLWYARRRLDFSRPALWMDGAWRGNRDGGRGPLMIRVAAVDAD